MKNKQNKTTYYIGIVTAACLMYAVSAGLRSVYGIMLGTISDKTGIAYASVSFVIAVGQLVFGIAQPVFGIIAIKKSNAFVLSLGCILMALGLGMIPFCADGWMLMIFLGILLPVGTGAVSFGIILGAVTPKLGERRAAAASGFINASSGIGSIVFSPMIQTLFSTAGFSITMFALSSIAILLIPISILAGRIKSGENSIAGNTAVDSSITKLLKKALSSKSYLYLMIGFFTCGFHMAIIETHLYSQILSYGITDSLAAVAFSAYGCASMIGSLFSGFLSIKFKMKYVVGSLYGGRAIIIMTFLLLPKTIPVIFAAVVFLGLTGSATVVPTSGLVSKLFGSKNLGTLFGFVFLCHQFGSFFSAWLGGRLFSVTGGYTHIWYAAAVLGVLASIVSFWIDEI